MSKEAKETINSIKKGDLPPLNDINNMPKKGVEINQRGLEKHNYGLQSINEGKNNHK